MRLLELQMKDQTAKKIKEQGLKISWEKIDGVLDQEDFPYWLEIIRIEIISRHHNDPLASHFGIGNTQEFVVRKYYLLILQADIEAYGKECDVCKTSKAVTHKSYGELQLLFLSTY